VVRRFSLFQQPNTNAIEFSKAMFDSQTKHYGSKERKKELKKKLQQEKTKGKKGKAAKETR
jgi:hypothetical protein